MRLCQLKKSDIKADPEKIIKLVSKPKHICLRCYRVCSRKKCLCKPAPLKELSDFVS